MKMISFLLFMTFTLHSGEITINVSEGIKPISPLIYGKNNSLSSNPLNPISAERWEMYRQAGLKMLRENGGNNATKYNWRRKLSSHPDWYNNVYSHDWDFEAQSLQDNMPFAHGMWAFQLIGYAASNTQNNFNDWEYNQSQWWEGVNNNWAGGGGPGTGEGNSDLYLMEWPADSTVGILDQWFDPKSLGLNQTQFQYWGMDNESEIWNGTHDDVMPVLISAEEYMQRYFAVAKKARAKFPNIKLTGPVPANEWQWYNWNNSKINYKSKRYTWLEYFILRIAEEQQASGIRLLDVVDVHFYPYESTAEDILQLHRVWFDKSYDYPGANGVKVSGSGEWDNNITNEYLFGRCKAWLEKHIGPDHGVTLGVSETGLNTNDPNVIAVWYASQLGVFADNGVEYFTPWEWQNEMWEVLHLFSRYSKEFNIASSSDQEEIVSAYSSINAELDSLTVILVNRSVNESQEVTVSLTNFIAEDGAYTSLMLNDLAHEMTFVSHTENALLTSTVDVSNNIFTISLPSLSITAIILNGQEAVTSLENVPQRFEFGINNYPNPFNPKTRIEYQINKSQDVKIQILNMNGQIIATLADGFKTSGAHSINWDASNYGSGIYFVQIATAGNIKSRKILFLK